MSSPTFHNDPVALMRKHRFPGAPTRMTAAIKDAIERGDQQALGTELLRAVTVMLNEPR